MVVSPQEAGFSDISSYQLLAALCSSLGCNISSVFHCRFFWGFFQYFPELLFLVSVSGVVVLSSCRDSATGFYVFDVQHQSSNLFSRGFTFLHKYQAVKNSFHVFSWEQHSSSFIDSVSQFVTTCRPGCFIQSSANWLRAKMTSLHPHGLSDRYRFLICVPGSLCHPIASAEVLLLSKHHTPAMSCS